MGVIAQTPEDQPEPTRRVLLHPPTGDLKEKGENTMANWWRIHNSIRESRKHMHQISGESFRDWVVFCSIANEFDEKTGKLPEKKKLEWLTHLSAKKLEKKLEILVEAGLIDCENGEYTIHDFASWQYRNGDLPGKKSSSYERVRAYRDREAAKKAAALPIVTEPVTVGVTVGVTAVTESVTVGVTLPLFETHETPSELQSYRNPVIPKRETAPEAALDLPKIFARMWAKHPKRTGKIPAEQAFAIAVAERPDDMAGTAELIERNHTAWCASEDWSRDGGRYVRKLENWLRDGDWLEAPPEQAKSQQSTMLSMEEQDRLVREHSERLYGS